MCDFHEARKMLRALIVLCGLLGLKGVASAQNLVPNWSFEEYIDCPSAGGQINRAVGWTNTQGSPEYFNACSSDEWASVPANKVGYQVPSTGDAYAGIITYSDSDWFVPPELLRERIGRYLVEPLIPGQPVFVSMRVSPAWGGMLGGRVRWTTEGIGVRFRMGPPILQDAQTATNDADLQLEEVLMDSAGWTLLSGFIVPDSAYDCIEIGNYVSDSLLNPVMIDSTGDYGVAYVYVDDLVVTYDDMSEAPTRQQEAAGALRLWPNPSAGLISVCFPDQVTSRHDIELTDALGRVVLSVSLSNPSLVHHIDLTALRSGRYLVRPVHEAYRWMPVVLILTNTRDSP